MKTEYAVQIVWSTEDSAYIALTLELPGCMADGQTPEEALSNLKVAIAEWIEVATEEKRPIPKPLSVQDLAKHNEHALAEQQKKIQECIQQEVEKAVGQVVEKLLIQQAASAWGEFQPRGFFHSEQLLVTAAGHDRR